MKAYYQIMYSAGGNWLGNAKVNVNNDIEDSYGCYAVYSSRQKAFKAIERFKDGSLALYDHFGFNPLNKRKNLGIYKCRGGVDKLLKEYNYKLNP